MTVVNNEFFQLVLRTLENDDSIVVTGFSCADACAKAENFASIVEKTTVVGTKKEKNKDIAYSKTLIVKVPTSSIFIIECYGSERLFKNEVYAYTEIIPKLRNYSYDPLPFPECYHADAKVIAMKDLSEDGYSMLRDVKSVTLDQSLAVMKEFANYHSASINCRVRNPPLFFSFKNSIKEMFVRKNLHTKSFMQTTLETYIGWMKSDDPTEQNKKAINYLNNMKDTFYEEICELFVNTCDLYVYNHGDCWMNNFLFKELAGEEVRVKLIDLQAVRLSSIASDITYFLYTSMYPELRREKLVFILEKYIEFLHGYLNNLGLPMEIDKYSLDWLQQEMTKFHLFGFMMALLFTPLFYCNKDNIPAPEDMCAENMECEAQIQFLNDNMTDELKARIFSLIYEYVNGKDAAF